jgi:hypothetical protein
MKDQPDPGPDVDYGIAPYANRYAELRRRLLVDPHLMENCQTQAQLNQDNPLSLDPGENCLLLFTMSRIGS